MNIISPSSIPSPTTVDGTNKEANLLVLNKQEEFDRAHFVFGWYYCPNCDTAHFKDPLIKESVYRQKMSVCCVVCGKLLDYLEVSDVSSETGVGGTDTKPRQKGCST